MCFGAQRGWPNGPTHPHASHLLPHWHVAAHRGTSHWRIRQQDPANGGHLIRRHVAIGCCDPFIRLLCTLSCILEKIAVALLLFPDEQGIFGLLAREIGREYQVLVPPNHPTLPILTIHAPNQRIARGRRRRRWTIPGSVVPCLLGRGS